MNKTANIKIKIIKNFPALIPETYTYLTDDNGKNKKS